MSFFTCVRFFAQAQVDGRSILTPDVIWLICNKSGGAIQSKDKQIRWWYGLNYFNEAEEPKNQKIKMVNMIVIIKSENVKNRICF